jgi:small-conductance mechanosensitive channel
LRRSDLLVTILFALAACWPGVGLAAEGSPTSQEPAVAPKEATITFWNRDIVTLRGTISGADPELRAEKVVRRLDELPLNTRSSDITLFPFNVEGQDGVGFTYHGKILFYIGTKDLDPVSRETLDEVAQRTLRNLDEALQARAAEESWPVIRSALIFTFVAFVLLAVAVTLIWRSHSRLIAMLHRREPLVRRPLQLMGIDLRPPIDSAVYGILRLIETILVVITLYFFATLTLSKFPYTQPWSHKIGRYVLDLLQQWGRSVVHAMPGLLAIILIFIVTRWIVGLARAFFGQVTAGRIRVSWLDPDMAGATQRIFAGVAWVFAVVVAYPYIPGSRSEAFKGISVFVGLVVSLGSTGIINQVTSGLFVVYSRALKPGEWVLINDIEGEVLEVGLLAGKIRTPEGQEVTIPNSVLVSTSTKNHTRLGSVDGMLISCTVTIGYGAPWRQVHALLLQAADHTPNVRKEPKPCVRQRQLGDFYVSYLLVARIENERLRLETLSDLHAHIQDAFNEYGVQIMSPHFMIQPSDAVVVPRSEWHAAPATENGSEADTRGRPAGA